MRFFSVNQGLSQYDVSDIVQDKYGFIWVATYDGLNRYDGIENRIFRYEPDNDGAINYNRLKTLYYDELSNKLWIGTEGGGINIYNYERDSFEHTYLVENQNSHLPENTINDILSESNERMWILTPAALFLTDKDVSGSSLKIIQTFPLSQNQASNKICMPSSHSLYVASENSILIYIRQAGNYFFRQEIQLPAGSGINDMFVDKEQNVWVATKLGLYRSSRVNTRKALEAKGGVKFERVVFRDQSESLTLSSFLALNQDGGEQYYAVVKGKGVYRWENWQNVDSARRMNIDNSQQQTGDIRQLYVDYSHTLWIGSPNTGLGIIDLVEKGFYKLRFAENGMEESPILITQLMIDNRNRLWTGSQKNGLSVRDLQSGKVDCYPFSDAAFSTITQTDSGNIWIVTGGQVFKVEEVNNCFRFLNLRSLITIPDSLNLGGAASVCEDDNGSLWVSYRRGVLNIRTGEGTFRVFPYEYQSHTKVIKDPLDNRIWVCTNKSGLMQLDLDIQGKISREFSYVHRKNDPQSLSSNVVWNLTRTRDGMVYVGTDAGLNKIDPVNQTVTRFTDVPKLCNYKILSIKEDHKGALWINTSQGLFAFNPQNRAMTEYNCTDGLSSNSMTEAAVITNDDIIYIGGNDGINYFSTNELGGNTVPPRLAVTGFMLSNKQVGVGEVVDGRVVLPKSILNVDKIELIHSQNNVTFEFATLSFNNPLKNGYQYRLQGYDKDWINVGATHRYASYGNLSPGKYIFEVRGINSDGIYSDELRKIELIIHPAPWSTVWAYLIYLLLLGGILLIVYRYYRKQQQMKHKLLIEQIKFQTEHEANENKIRFYINVTHELRTPLTLIMAPLEELERDTTLNHSARSLVGAMKRNSRRLLDLVNQFLDLRKIDSQNMALEVVYKDWVGVLFVVKEHFDIMSQYKNIDYQFYFEERPMMGWIDVEKVTRMVSNLLSNAFKFTPDGGRVLISLFSKGEYYVVEIEDSGCGIARAYIEKIFDRFYQVSQNNSSGTGIGLELTKRLAEMHKGTVSVTSTVGVGSVFRLEFPTDEIFYPQEVRFPTEQEEEYTPMASTLADGADVAEEIEHGVQPERTILIVEDDEDMRNYVISLLRNNYIVAEASNGEEGLKLALKVMPDLIVTDVMMPEMDGIELCKQVRQDFRISHIPVIMLTAKFSELEGLQSGAIDYVMKPFSPSSLKLKINNILSYWAQRKLSSNVDTAISARIAEFSEEKEKAFLERAWSVVENKMGDSDFGVEELIKELTISRTQLHRKMITLTGKSASAFVRNIRLDKAKEMLETGKYSISEVLYTVGFNSPSYFSKTYKERFGTLPSELFNQ